MNPFHADSQFQPLCNPNLSFANHRAASAQRVSNSPSRPCHLVDGVKRTNKAQSSAEAVESTASESEDGAVDTVSVGRDVSACAAATEAFAEEEGHFGVCVWFVRVWWCRQRLRLEASWSER